MRKLINHILSGGLARRILNPEFGKISKVQEGNICILLSQTNRLGDLVMHNFLTQQLGEHGYTVSYGLSAEFFERFRHFFENHSETDRFLVLPKTRWERWRFIRQIKKANVKAVVIDHFPLFDPIYFYLAGVPVIVGPPGGKSSPFYTKENKLEKLKVHYTDLVHAMLDLIGGSKKFSQSHTIKPFFPFKKVRLKELDNESGVSLTVHIGGYSQWDRRWPVAYYLDVCELFLKKYGGKIFLIGGMEEYDQCEEVKRMLMERLGYKDRVVNFAGTNLDAMATIIAASTVYLGNDSGPMHIATALNKRVIGIFGPSPIAVVNPTKYDSRNVTIHLKLPCVPCVKQQCRFSGDEKLSCLTGLPPAMVWRQLNEVLAAIEQPALHNSVNV
jgi:ADP-heptose:LPS heptosyltransferase